jgi:hypothetical protein
MMKEFKVEFIHWAEIPLCSEGPVMCDFCEERPVEWYCDFLVTGYCKECMAEQEEEYNRLARLDG